MKHHYIPCFYTSRWAIRTDRKLCEFSQPHDVVIDRRKHPAATGYEHDLYLLPSVEADKQHQLERRFFAGIDQRAFEISERMMRFGQINFQNAERSAWFRFIMSLRQRNPETVRQLRKKARELLDIEMTRLSSEYEAKRTSNDPKTFEEFADSAEKSQFFERAEVLALQNVIDLPLAGQHFINMRWALFNTSKTGIRLLTSDRPAIFSSGMLNREAHIALPISPDWLFVSANEDRVLAQIKSLRDDLPKRVNELVTRAAKRFVYSVDNQEYRFVARRFRDNEVVKR